MGFWILRGVKIQTTMVEETEMSLPILICEH